MENRNVDVNLTVNPYNETMITNAVLGWLTLNNLYGYNGRVNNKDIGWDGVRSLITGIDAELVLSLTCNGRDYQVSLCFDEVHNEYSPFVRFGCYVSRKCISDDERDLKFYEETWNLLDYPDRIVHRTLEYIKDCNEGI